MSNKPNNGNRWGNEVRMAFLREYAELPLGTSGRRLGVKALRLSYGVGQATADRWIQAHGPMKKCGRKLKVSTTGVDNEVVTYYLGDLNFPTKESAVRYAVEMMGGLTMKSVTTKTIVKKVEF